MQWSQKGISIKVSTRLATADDLFKNSYFTVSQEKLPCKIMDATQFIIDSSEVYYKQYTKDGIINDEAIELIYKKYDTTTSYKLYFKDDDNYENKIFTVS